MWVSSPKRKRQLIRFLGITGYYRNLCPKFFTVEKLRICSLESETAFQKLKAILERSEVQKFQTLLCFLRYT